jgi:hypothetical protein
MPLDYLAFLFLQLFVTYAVHAMGVPCSKTSCIGIATGKLSVKQNRHMGRFLVVSQAQRGSAAKIEHTETGTPGTCPFRPSGD